MLPEILENGLRSPNNNTDVPRNRGSLCLSPVSTPPFVLDNKRRSWCGTQSNNANTPVKRYGELGILKHR